MIDIVEDWEYIEGFPMYMISNLGEVRNIKTGRLLHITKSSRGGSKVGLVFDGVQYSRSVRTLVADAFLPDKTDIFNTAINRDGDKTNNHISNLVWRPRWFAVKYARQFVVDYANADRGPIQDVESGLVYFTVREAAIENGLLFKEVFGSCLSGESVFPTWQTFDWLR